MIGIVPVPLEGTDIDAYNISDDSGAYVWYNMGEDSCLYAKKELVYGEIPFTFDKVNQIFTMTLNLKERTLKFDIDGKEWNLGYTDVDNTKEYRLGISFEQGINELELLE